MQFANCAAVAVLFTTRFNCKSLFFNWKFETLFFCWGWDCS